MAKKEKKEKEDKIQTMMTKYYSENSRLGNAKKNAKPFRKQVEIVCYGGISMPFKTKQKLFEMKSQTV